ncbi:hypothetical protein FVEG_08533 [Fusarium verticillioides 7600]|uniref:Uncharacterized protein n=1 Tax=Gibberella moniliformis (strain M3125 / FGSC 7600) TaxID=334819 RepID=W7MMY1_GIBM7|nr:hypothetical protein FVEG_08533 [Fusarium verticillioides 7600]EWG48880.1 hypothetical protein FVEG_08533 [Fusarium verticillioides 7600]
MVGHAAQVYWLSKGFICAPSRNNLDILHEEIHDLIFPIKETGLQPAQIHINLKYPWVGSQISRVEYNGSDFHLVISKSESPGDLFFPTCKQSFMISGLSLERVRILARALGVDDEPPTESSVQC